MRKAVPTKKAAAGTRAAGSSCVHMVWYAIQASSPRYTPYTAHTAALLTQNSTFFAVPWLRNQRSIAR